MQNSERRMQNEGEYDWINLSLPEHRKYLLAEANEMAGRLKQMSCLEAKYKQEVVRRKNAEEQLALLQTTLALVSHKQKCRRGCKLGRT